MKCELRIICEEDGDNFGFLIQRKGRKEEVVHYNELSREEQIRAIRLIDAGCRLYVRYLKEE